MWYINTRKQPVLQHESLQRFENEQKRKVKHCVALIAMKINATSVRNSDHYWSSKAVRRKLKKFMLWMISHFLHKRIEHSKRTQYQTRDSDLTLCYQNFLISIQPTQTPGAAVSVSADGWRQLDLHNCSAVIISCRPRNGIFWCIC